MGNPDFREKGGGSQETDHGSFTGSQGSDVQPTIKEVVSTRSASRETATVHGNGSAFTFVRTAEVTRTTQTFVPTSRESTSRPVVPTPEPSSSDTTKLGMMPAGGVVPNPTPDTTITENGKTYVISAIYSVPGGSDGRPNSGDAPRPEARATDHRASMPRAAADQPTSSTSERPASTGDPLRDAVRAMIAEDDTPGPTPQAAKEPSAASSTVRAEHVPGIENMNWQAIWPEAKSVRFEEPRVEQAVPRPEREEKKQPTDNESKKPFIEQVVDKVRAQAFKAAETSAPAGRPQSESGYQEKWGGLTREERDTKNAQYAGHDSQEKVVNGEATTVTAKIMEATGKDTNVLRPDGRIGAGRVSDVAVKGVPVAKDIHDIDHRVLGVIADAVDADPSSQAYDRALAEGDITYEDYKVHRDALEAEARTALVGAVQEITGSDTVDQGSRTEPLTIHNASVGMMNAAISDREAFSARAETLTGDAAVIAQRVLDATSGENITSAEDDNVQSERAHYLKNAFDDDPTLGTVSIDQVEGLDGKLHPVMVVETTLTEQEQREIVKDGMLVDHNNDSRLHGQQMVDRWDDYNPYGRVWDADTQTWQDPIRMQDEQNRADALAEIKRNAAPSSKDFDIYKHPQNVVLEGEVVLTEDADVDQVAHDDAATEEAGAEQHEGPEAAPIGGDARAQETVDDSSDDGESDSDVGGGSSLAERIKMDENR